jgi:hypothetical protein
MCCGPTIKSSPLYRAATAADVDVLKILLAQKPNLEWTPAEIKSTDAKPAGPGANANNGQTPLMAAMKGGNGPAIQGGPGYTRTGPPPFREPGDRDPQEALKLLIAAGANVNAKAPDGSTPLHQAVQAQQVAMIRELAAAGASLSAVNKDNLTPLLLAEKLPKTVAPVNPGAVGAGPATRLKKDSREDVIAAVRELMHLGPDDPAPQPPPLEKKPDADKKADAKPVPAPAKGTR